MKQSISITEGDIEVTAAIHKSNIRTGAYEMTTTVLGTITNQRQTLILKCNASDELAKKLSMAGWAAEWVRWNGMNVTLWMP